MKPFNKFSFLLLAMCTALAGCASMIDDPELKAILASPQEVEVEDKIELAKLAWIGQDLLEPKVRGDAAEILAQEKLPKAWEGYEYSTLGSMTGDLVTGKVGSNLGGAIGGAILIADLFSGDGSSDYVSGLFLPKNINGSLLDTPEAARQFGTEMIAKQVIEAGVTLGYGVSCEYGCENNSYNRIYRFDRQTKQESVYIYQPDVFTVSMFIGKMVESDKEKVLNSIATGEPVEWQSEEINGAVLVIANQPVYTDEGKLKLFDIQRSDGDIKIAGGQLRFLKSAFGRNVQREIYKTPFHYQGQLLSSNKFLAYNGNIYRIGVNSSLLAFKNRLVD